MRSTVRFLLHAIFPTVPFTVSNWNPNSQFSLVTWIQRDTWNFISRKLEQAYAMAESEHRAKRPRITRSVIRSLNFWPTLKYIYSYSTIHYLRFFLYFSVIMGLELGFYLPSPIEFRFVLVVSENERGKVQHLHIGLVFSFRGPR